MRLVKLRFAIVIYPSEANDVGRFTAHCLNMDVLADDDSVEGALSKLMETIEAKLDYAEAYGADPFDRAPDCYWKKIATASKLPPDIWERAVRNANRRLGHGEDSKRIDLQEQCDVRQTEAVLA